MKAALLSIILVALCFSSANSQTSTTASTSTSPTQEKVAAKTDGSATSSSAPAGLKIGKDALSLPPEKANPVKITLFAKPPTIDGKLDDDVWQGAVLLKDFYQVQPGDNLVPQYRTEVRLGYDPKFLYIASTVLTTPVKFVRMPKRDQIWDDDYVGILFDTFNDQRRAYEFDFNPLGVRLMESGRKAGRDFSLDLVMESKGLVTEDGYTIEVAIPFKSLR